MRDDRVTKIAIIQVRTDSQRLASKCFGGIAGKRLIDHVIERALQIPAVDEVFLATTARKDDDLLEYEVSKYLPDGLLIFRGSDDDVQSRFLEIGRRDNDVLISRITADDPFRDPLASEYGFNFLLENPDVDYFSFAEDSLPIGLNCEVFRYSALELSRELCQSKYSREHVTSFIKLDPQFPKFEAEAGMGYLNQVRLTVDYLEDLIFSDLVGRKLLDLGLGQSFQDTSNALRAVLDERAYLTRAGSY